MGNVLRRCPDVGETFQCRRADSRRCDEPAVFFNVSGRCFRGVDIVPVLLECLVHVARSGHVLLFYFRQVFSEESLPQSQVVNLILLHEIVVRHFARLLDDGSQQQEVRGALLHVRSRFEGQWQCGYGLDQLFRTIIGRDVETLLRAVVGDARAVLHQLEDADRFPAFRHIFQVLADGVVQVEFAPFVELHHRHGSISLRDGADGPERLGGGEVSFREIGHSVAHHPGDVRRLYDGKRHARYSLFFHKIVNHLVDGLALVGNVHISPAGLRQLVLILLHNGSSVLCRDRCRSQQCD